MHMSTSFDMFLKSSFDCTCTTFKFLLTAIHKNIFFKQGQILLKTDLRLSASDLLNLLCVREIDE
jgi:hypothetical protein